MGYILLITRAACGSASLGFGSFVFLFSSISRHVIKMLQLRANLHTPSGNRCCDMFAFLIFSTKYLLKPVAIVRLSQDTVCSSAGFPPSASKTFVITTDRI